MALNITRKATRSELFDIYASAKKGESFSNVEPSKFYKYMGININNLLSSVFPLSNNIDSYINDEIINNLLITLGTNFHAEGNPTTGNEAKRSDFVQPFLSSIVAMYNFDMHKDVSLQREFGIENNLSSGVVEFVIVENDIRIMMVIEAKKESWDKGRAQNLLEIFAAHASNEEQLNLPPTHIVYGIVSTGDLWEIYSYTSSMPKTLGEWRFHGRFEPLKIKDIKSRKVFDPNNIIILMNILDTMMKNTINF